MASVQLFHGEKTVQVPSQSGSGQQSFLELIQSCPHLGGKESLFEATKYLFNGHLQTAYAAFYKGTPSMDLIKYDRHHLVLEDGGAIALDWWPRLASADVTIEKPVVVYLHGLTGGSHESYIRGVIEELTSRSDAFQTVVINNRGCGRSEIRTPKLFSGRYTDDVRYAFKQIQQRVKPGTPIIALGFSLGANILVNYLGEEGDRTPITAAVSVANPFDFEKTSHILTTQTFSRHAYSASMGTSLKNMFKLHEPVLHKCDKIDADEIMAGYTLRDFDDAFTRRMFDYPSVDAYYKDASSTQRICNVKVPLLCLNALDDPIAHHTALPYEEVKANEHVILAVTSHGGHIGYFENMVSPSRWLSKPLVEFIMAVADAYTEKA
ncbi:Alpha/Beta hydrolase protein [Gongronella butleri]|nr:Alpha/Beta hydrolase protein [Gongronella butleri]